MSSDGETIDSEKLIQCRTEALKQIREWSTGLITIQTAGIGALGFWLQRDNGLVATILALVAGGFLLASILMGAVFLGLTIPYCIAVVATRTKDEHDPFLYSGGRGHWTIGDMVSRQSWLFVASLLFFGIAAAAGAYARRPQADITTIDGTIHVIQDSVRNTNPPG